jgi:death on curing protein
MAEISFLSVSDILEIQARVISEFGGISGLRDRGLLESAVGMPRAMYSGEYLHSGLPSMAAAYHYHLCSNHCFVDGNKRVAVVAAEIFLLVNGMELKAADSELEELTLDLASGKISKDEVLAFFEQHVVAL